MLPATLVLLAAAVTDKTCDVVRDLWPNETTQLSLGCGEPGSVLSSIDFAAYGDSKCASRINAISSPVQPACHECGNKFSRGDSCDAKNATSIVSTLCLNKPSCSIPVTSKAFGDPCPGIGKWLTVVASCSKPAPSVPTPRPPRPTPAPTSSWQPKFDIKGSYDGPMCESTPFWWPKDKKMYLMECVCRGPEDGREYGGTWSHAELWDPQYKDHSYIRIRDMASGAIIMNITSSIGFGFGAAFVDYDHGNLWISATANDRAGHNSPPRPYGPKHTSCGHYECGVWVFNSSDLLTWSRTQTDIARNTLGTPNTDIARVYRDDDDDAPSTAASTAPSPSTAHPTAHGHGHGHGQSLHPLPANLPPHRYVMATESGSPWIVNNNKNGDLTKGWIVLDSAAAEGGSSACPSVRYLPSDGFYYTISGGHIIELQRSRDLLHWEKAQENFVQASPADILTASSVMATAAANLERSNASLSFPHRGEWDHDSNDGDFCCESWGGASADKGGPAGSYVLWGADGQGASGFKAGPEGFAVIATANVTLDKLLQSYF